jgi:thiosulfate dehydrogenase (quinone) large subunit
MPRSWFAWLIILGEIAVGLGLILGALTGIAAFFGALMNVSFLLAGSASTNPVLFTMAIGLMLAWKVAGYYGVDRWLLPMLGTPWRPGACSPGEAPSP